MEAVPGPVALGCEGSCHPTRAPSWGNAYAGRWDMVSMGSDPPRHLPHALRPITGGDRGGGHIPTYPCDLAPSPLSQNTWPQARCWGRWDSRGGHTCHSEPMKLLFNPTWGLDLICDFGANQRALLSLRFLICFMG